ncbi:hypothetical protein pEaSNUABM14_00054 [Erwinia phage pEa_SNUABM_14]|nr:hypothetical protein pEaSNUABM45_00054 [Erwinia phage pEa_SNUABM_45]QYW04038.1 hypothetical protein pEaSNUABM46_00054 [Erwinia phage pEa_SNUABM_46]QYW04379.1 hypothetical protein pEaSNUABM14_00054 [Erwinia phage pEa_SNUABM_14]
MNDPVVLWSIIGVLLFILACGGAFIYFLLRTVSETIFRSLWGGH